MYKINYYLDLSIAFMKNKSKDYFVKYLKGQSQMIKACTCNGYILSTYYIPNEIFSLFDVPLLYGERVAGFGAACNLTMYNKDNFPAFFDNICSYQCFLENMFNSDQIPLPCYIVAADYPCRSAFSYFKYLADKHNIPFLGISVSRVGNRVDIINRLSIQFEALFRDLQNKFKMIHSVKEICEISNETLEKKKKIDEIRYRYPGIISSQQLMNIFPIVNDFGRIFARDSMEQLFNEIEERVNDYRTPQNTRLLWLGTTPLYYHLLSKIEQEYNCTFVYEDLFDYPYVYLDENIFLKKIAMRLVESIFYNIDARIDSLIKVVNRYEADGVIHFLQKGCSFLPSAYPQIESRLKQNGVMVTKLIGDGINRKDCFNVYRKDLDEFMNKVKNGNKICI